MAQGMDMENTGMGSMDTENTVRVATAMESKEK